MRDNTRNIKCLKLGLLWDNYRVLIALESTIGKCDHLSDSISLLIKSLEWDIIIGQGPEVSDGSHRSRERINSRLQEYYYIKSLPPCM